MFMRDLIQIQIYQKLSDDQICPSRITRETRLFHHELYPAIRKTVGTRLGSYASFMDHALTFDVQADILSELYNHLPKSWGDSVVTS